MVNFRSCCLKSRTFTALFAFMTVVLFTSLNLQASATTKKLSPEDRMSSTGRVAASVRKQLRKAGVAGVSTRSAIANYVNTPDDCDDGFSEGRLADRPKPRSQSTQPGSTSLLDSTTPAVLV